jgi:hypothetical protein
MAVTLTTAARNAAADAITALIGASGRLKLYLANASTEVANLALNADAFGDAATGVSTMAVASAVEDTNCTGNAAAATVAKFMTSGGTEVFRCSVGTSGADINFTNNIIAAGETARVTSFTLTVPA